MDVQHVLAGGQACSPGMIPYPTVFGAEFTSLEANLVSNFSSTPYGGLYFGHPSINITNIEFCNVTVTYTHPGQNDIVQTQVYLPTENWNERMQGIGGGGWMAGMFELSEVGMLSAAAEGYAAVTTDGGHKSLEPDDWALASPGNVDLYALQNLASVTLRDAAEIGKYVSRSFYGRRPKYSYWNGCSQGGRQGLMLAQRYPTAYDGIHASAPAIYWSQLLVGTYWPQLVMNHLQLYPLGCEFQALTAAAISACDKNDGVADGIVADPESCVFDPMHLVGQSASCPEAGKDIRISHGAALAAKAAWRGAERTDGSQLWDGLNYEASLTGRVGIVNTNCSDIDRCVGEPFGISEDWIRLFIKKDPSFNVINITHEEFQSIFHASIQEYSSIGTDDADLGEFRKAGGKMITYHGLADGLISPRSTERYYNSVASLHPDVHEFYRLFESPGLGHCFHGKGAYPYNAFDSLVAWVEDGVAPDSLLGEITTERPDKKKKRLLCPYPLKAKYDRKGDPDSEDSYSCTW